VGKRQPGSVQHLAGCGVVGEFFEVMILSVAVDKITDQRVTNKLEVHPHLVSAASVYVYFGQSRATEAFEHTIGGARIAAEILHNRHAFSVRRMPCEGGPDFANVALHFSAENCVVDFLNLSTGELSREGDMSGVALGHHKASTGVFVEAMNDAWARDSADPAELAAAMMQQCVHQSVLLVAGRWMHDDSRRFINNQQAVVFEQYVQLHGLWLRLRRPSLRPMNLNFLARMRHMRRFCRLAV
jgi:hypothetical protein